MRSPTGYRVRKPTREPHVGRLQARVAKGQTLAEAADGLGIPFWLAKAVFVRSGLPIPKPPRRSRTTGASRSWPRAPRGRTAEAVREGQRLHVALALRLFSHELAAQSGVRGPVPVTMRHWDARRDPRVHPSSARVLTLFGTWGEACRAAGVPIRTRRQLQ